MNIFQQLEEKEEQIREILIQYDKITIQLIINEFVRVSRHTRFILSRYDYLLDKYKLKTHINKNYIYELVYCQENLSNLQKIDNRNMLNIQQIISFIESILQSFTAKELNCILEQQASDIKLINKSKFNKSDPFRYMKYKKDMLHVMHKKNKYSFRICNTKSGYVDTGNKLELAIALAYNMNVTFGNILYTTIDYECTPKLLKAIIDYSVVIQQSSVLYPEEFWVFDDSLYLTDRIMTVLKYKQEITAIELLRILAKSEILFELVEKYMSKDIIKEILNK